MDFRKSLKKKTKIVNKYQNFIILRFLWSSQKWAVQL